MGEHTKFINKASLKILTKKRIQVFAMSCCLRRSANGDVAFVCIANIEQSSLGERNEGHVTIGTPSQTTSNTEFQPQRRRVKELMESEKGKELRERILTMKVSVEEVARKEDGSHEHIGFELIFKVDPIRHKIEE
ncbi:hypothetical protein RIF29_29334 [Crotalaria pallida]|uniref:Uncharacterized protein n=1 Tax=Crotalaria pallida TaxID=3830 RepID=A0AAN9EEN3_CROPI